MDADEVRNLVKLWPVYGTKVPVRSRVREKLGIDGLGKDTGDVDSSAKDTTTPYS